MSSKGKFSIKALGELYLKIILTAFWDKLVTSEHTYIKVTLLHLILLIEWQNSSTAVLILIGSLTRLKLFFRINSKDYIRCLYD